MRSLLVVGFGAVLLACGGSEGQGGDTRPEPEVADGAHAEGLFGDWAGYDGTPPPVDGVTPDAADDTAIDGVAPADADHDLPPDVTPEVVVPVAWDVVVLTALNGHLYRNGVFYTVVQKTNASPFVGLDGLMTRYYTLTEDGQGRTDGEPTFVAAGVPNGVTFVDLAASTSAAGSYFFTLQSNGQVRNGGAAMLTVAAPGGEAWAALAAEGAEFYPATSAGTIYQKGQLHPQVAIPVPAGDSLVTLRVLNGQFYGLTQAGKVYKNTVLLHDLAAKAAPPFVGLDVNAEHVYVVTRGCTVFEDGAVTATLTPFAGDYCTALALIHSLD